MPDTTQILVGAKMEWSSDGGTTYVKIDECRTFARPVIEAELRDRTNLDSTDWKEFGNGMNEAAEMTLMFPFNETTFTAWKTHEAASDHVHIKATLPVPDGSTTGRSSEFRCLLRNVNFDTDTHGDDMMVSVKLKPVELIAEVAAA